MTAGEVSSDEVSVAGRIVNIRTSSKKLYFFDVKGEGKELQVFANASFVVLARVVRIVSLSHPVGLTREILQP